MTTDEDMMKFARRVAEELERWKREPQFLNEADAAKLVGLTPRSLQQMRYDGSGPPFVKLGDSKAAPIRYSLADLHLWINTRQRFYSTRAALAAEERQLRNEKSPGSLAAHIEMATT